MCDSELDAVVDDLYAEIDKLNDQLEALTTVFVLMMSAEGLETPPPKLRLIKGK